jgi:hypothetical protein
MTDLRKANAGSRSAFAEIYNGFEALGVSQSVLEQETVAQSKQFQNDGKGELRHIETGETITEWLAKLRETKPHFFPDYIPAEISEADEARAIIDAATLTPTPASLSALFNRFSVAKAQEILKASGVDIKPDRHGRIKPGKKITVADDGKATVEDGPKEDRRSNPFSREGWNVTKQGSLIKSLGPEKAAAIARSVGSYIGATKPPKG